jgi:hypothetical protein
MDKHCLKTNPTNRKRKRTDEISSPELELTPPPALDNDIAQQIVKSFLETAFINNGLA